MKKYFAVLAVALSSFTGVFTDAARANDGSIAWGGSPQLLSSHPSVAMQSEVIVMNIGKENVTVDCRFVFKNYGKATAVRMGFPDAGSGDTPHQDAFDNDVSAKRAHTAFTSFKSWVDGKAVKTQLIRADESQKSWHAKTVYFPALSTRIVRDLYTVPVGGQFSRNRIYSQTSYTLHTGASWRGAIGRSEVIVNFINTGGADILRPLTLKAAKAQYVDDVDWSKLPRGTILYRGPVAPTTKGRTLRFVRTNWNPRESDDIWLAFNPRGLNG